MTITELLSLALFAALGAWLLLSRWPKMGWFPAAALALTAWVLSLAPLVWGAFLLLAALMVLTSALVTLPPPALKRVDQWRGYAQAACALSFGAIAVQYALHVMQLWDGIPWIARPDLVDGFLPIAAGIQLQAWLVEGYWDGHHPAGVILLLLTLLVSLGVKRAFCGWICPLGWVGERLYQFRLKFWPAKLTPPAWLDWPLRSLKYILLGGIIAIVLSLGGQGSVGFLNGRYHQAADLKMWYLFASPTLVTALCVVLVVAVMALRRGALCRYLCPYGAWLAIGGLLSPFKVRRNPQRCLKEAKGMACDKCTRACPAGIPVDRRGTVHSDECNSCQRCVSACPVKGAVTVSLPGHRLPLSPLALVLWLMLVMLVLPFLLHGADLWQSSTDPEFRSVLLNNLGFLGH
ncbi:4Fe-4S binding protein [Ferrimonas futtsuensis]|uniref:4Fe-4S binding protein n=1 Tax=Ferrimonas futtsuensis TaxID=364764 RepID=UPI0003F9CC73|nr:4Fe-4S binding protein [Ferrimonas futtsuensis]